MTEGKPFKPAQLRAQDDLAVARGQLAVARASGSVEVSDVNRVKQAERRAGVKSSSSTSAPPDNARPDDYSVPFVLAPQRATVELNGFRIADKAQVTVALRDLPLHPDVVRSMLVEVYMWADVAVSDFGDPGLWVRPLLTQPPMFRGYVDVEDLEASDDNFSVQLQARSLEARLMDAKVNPLSRARRIKRNDSSTDPATGKVTRGEKLTSFVRRFVATIPEFSGALGGAAIGVRLYPNVDPKHEPVLGADMFLRSVQTAQSRAAAGGQVQGAPTTPVGGDPALAAAPGSPVLQPTGPGELSAWDVITRACELTGYIPIYDPSVVATAPDGTVVRGADNILLVLPQTLMETPQDGITIPGGPLDGFERQFNVGGTRIVRSQVRFMVWGKNVKNLKFSRKYGRIKAPAIRVVCHDPDGRPGSRTLVSQYPKTRRGTQASALGTGAYSKGGPGRGHPPVEEIVTKVVRGIRSQADLDRIAVSLYHTVSRQEVSCEIETDDMSSYVDPAFPDATPDLLNLRPGTPCRVSVARSVEDPAAPGAVTVSELSELFERRANPAFLRKLLLQGGRRVGLSDQGLRRIEASLATIEQAYDRARLTDYFYCKAVNHDWSSDDGYSCHMELVNFLEARSLPANLGAGDKAQADLDKLLKGGVTQTARERSLAQTTDALLTSLAKGG